MRLKTFLIYSFIYYIYIKFIFYKINILQFEAKEDILVFKIKYDMKLYSDFKNYCSDNFLHKKRIAY